VYINITIGRTPASWGDTSDKFDYLDLMTNIVYSVSTACFDHLRGQIKSAYGVPKFSECILARECGHCVESPDI